MGERPDYQPWAKASCHCGHLQIEVRLVTKRLLACNCSICIKKGFLHLIVSQADVRGTSEDNRAEYRFGSKTARHFFCSNCGITPYYIPRSHPDGVSVNARCLEGFDPNDFEIEPFDGQNWEKNVRSIR